MKKRYQAFCFYLYLTKDTFYLNDEENLLPQTGKYSIGSIGPSLQYQEIGSNKIDFISGFDSKYMKIFEELVSSLNSRCLESVKSYDLVCTILYVGGHPLLMNSRSIHFRLSNEHIELIDKMNNTNVRIPLGEIVNTSIEKQESIERRITATRIFFLGFYALAFQKKKVNTQEFLTIDVKDKSGQEYVVIFQNDNILEIRKMIFENIQRYRNKLSDHIRNEEDGLSISEQIISIKKLLDDGIISEDEFTRIKSKIIGSI